MEVYQAVDNTIMKGVNAAVRAWNWTTGRTRADLANLMLGVAPIGECTGYFGSLSFVGVPFGIVCLFGSHYAQKENQEVDSFEKKAAQSGVMDPNVERIRTRHRVMGPSFIGVSGFQASLGFIPKNENPEYNAMTSAGHALRAGSCYVMRTRYLPPRKHCVSLARDKLREIVEEYRARPAIVPALVGRADF